MKRFLILLIGLTLFLAACGSDNNETIEPEENNQEETDDTGEQDAIAGVGDTILDNGDYVYEIKDIVQMESKFKDGTQLLAIEISFTNNTDDPTSPWMAQGFKAEQETETTVELLNGANGQFPEEYKADLVKMGDTDIKPGATADAIIGYEILYPGEPVKLTDFSFTDEILFERIVETEE